MYRMSLKYLLTSLESNFKQNIIFLSISVVFLISLFSSLIIYQNNINVKMHKYSQFTSEYLYLEMTPDFDNPYTINSLYDQKLSKIKNVIYTRYSIKNMYIENDAYKLDVKIKGTTSNFLSNADSVDYSYSESNILNLKKNKLQSGRIWTLDEFKNKEKVILIYNSTAFLLFGTNDVIGSNLNLGEDSYKIIGILKDCDDVKYYNTRIQTIKDVKEIVIYTPITNLGTEAYIIYSFMLTGDIDKTKDIISNNISEKMIMMSSKDVLSKLEEGIIFESRYFYMAILINVFVVLISSFQLIKNYLSSKTYDYHLRRAQGMTKKSLYFMIIFQLSFLALLTIISALVFSVTISLLIFYISYKNIFPYIIIIKISDLFILSGLYLFICIMITSVLSTKLINKNIIDVIRME